MVEGPQKIKMPAQEIDFHKSSSGQSITNKENRIATNASNDKAKKNRL